MIPFFKHIAVRFFGQRSHTANIPYHTFVVITDDELREAYEWANAYGGGPCLYPKAEAWFLARKGAPDSVLATLRKLVAQ